MNKKKLFSAAGYWLLAVGCCMAQQRIDVNIWQETNPVAKVKDLSSGVLHVFPAPKDNNCGRAVIMCPGGGYARYSMNNEGFDWVPFFHSLGYSVAVLKYALPHGDPSLPTRDVEQAMRVMRQKAGEWGIHADSIGIMGFSAGGHLASTLTVTDKAEVRPAFSILFYPVITMNRSYTHLRSHDELMTQDATPELEAQYSSEQHVTADTPPTFLVMSNDDRTVLPKNGVMFYLAMLEKNRPASLHIYPTGRHGWGFRDTFRYHSQMLDELTTWLKYLGVEDVKPKKK